MDRKKSYSDAFWQQMIPLIGSGRNTKIWLKSLNRLSNDQCLIIRSAHSHAFDLLTKATVELIADFRCLDARLIILQQKYARQDYPRRLHSFQIRRDANSFFP